jgi:hypothetical protein
MPSPLNRLLKIFVFRHPVTGAEPAPGLTRGRHRHFSIAQAIEKWSKAEIEFLLCVLKNDRDVVFQHTVIPRPGQAAGS